MGGHGATGTTKYQSIHEIPDELVSQFSKRDPDNKFYQTRRWVNFKKSQILYQQKDGIPNYKRTFMKRCVYYGTWTSTLSLLAVNLYLVCTSESRKKK